MLRNYEKIHLSVKKCLKHYLHIEWKKQQLETTLYWWKNEEKKIEEKSVTMRRSDGENETHRLKGVGIHHTDTHAYTLNKQNIKSMSKAIYSLIFTNFYYCNTQCGNILAEDEELHTRK